MLIRIHEADPSVPLFELSEKTSEQIFALQRICEQHMDTILADEELVWAVLENYIPSILIQRLGKASIMNTLRIRGAETVSGCHYLQKTGIHGFLQIWNRMASLHEQGVRQFQRRVAELPQPACPAHELITRHK